MIFTDPDLQELDRIWPLGQKLVVPENGGIVVIGAYEGRYIAYLLERFPTAYVFGYEPQADKFNRLRERFRKVPKIDLFNFGLGTASRESKIGNSGTDGASVASANDKIESVRVFDAVTELGNYRNVDLLLLNCEGSEWPLIPYLLDELMHHRIRSMAIQFHPKYVSESCQKRVLGHLAEYYNNTYMDWPDWTMWVRKDLC